MATPAGRAASDPTRRPARPRGAGGPPPDRASDSPIPRRLPIEPAYLAKPVYRHHHRERVELGQALRTVCPREEHGAWVPLPGRRDPVDVCLEGDAGRLERLLPIKYGRMLASPFAFFRGSAALMASDLATTPSTGYAVQACGDCHLLNFGAFATPERRIIFDINDFDETHPAPWEWDLKRLAASFVVASVANGHGRNQARKAAVRAVRGYSDRLRELGLQPVLAGWYSSIDWENVVEQTDDPVLRRRRRRVLEKAIDRDPSQEFVRLGHFVDGRPRIKDDPPLIYHPDEEDDPDFRPVAIANFEHYRPSLAAERRVLFDRFEIADVAVKVVGIGSVGLTCAIGLFFAAEDDVLFLQVKEVRPSVLEPYVESHSHESHGERVVFGQRLMQAASDLFLGHMVGLRGRHWYVRQLRDVKIRPMVELYTPAAMRDYARTCGRALANAHARSGDPAVIAGYIGEDGVFEQAIGDFALAYADQSAADHRLLVEAVRAGRMEARLGD